MLRSVVTKLLAFPSHKIGLRATSSVGNQLYQTDANALHIRSASAKGIRINDQIIQSSIIVYKNTWQRWSVTDGEKISVESLKDVVALQPHPDLLLIGTGAKLHRLSPEVSRWLRSQDIAVEEMLTV
eukprot:TRINITY_DN5471_c0_g1_i2.p1 TRINITY_DN5471_c0_g1~~TRINITY_DN5471_c0_g1_i2.p1  ORF type:complete len:127 (-),score=32.92 TRINITY_DN5471_c0_g1_i2:719-1099(-)